MGSQSFPPKSLLSPPPAKPCVLPQSSADNLYLVDFKLYSDLQDFFFRRNVLERWTTGTYFLALLVDKQVTKSDNKQPELAAPMVVEFALNIIF